MIKKKEKIYITTTKGKRTNQKQKTNKKFVELKYFITFALALKAMGSFQSGQMGQTVNLLLLASVVRIHHYPHYKKYSKRGCYQFR